MVILALPLAAQAYYSETDYRVTDQLTTSGTYGSAGNGFKITWDITQATAASPFHYVYTLMGDPLYGGSPPIGLSQNLSHWILQVSADAVIADFFNFTPTYTSTTAIRSPKWYAQQGNQGMPVSGIYGIKFNSDADYRKTGDPVADSQIYVFSFDTLRMPTWGDFYAKDGQNSYAYNIGFGTAPPESGGTDWIRVPDTQMVVPAPATLVLLGSGLLALACLGRRKV